MIFAVPAGSPEELGYGLIRSFERVREETGSLPSDRLTALLFAPDGAPLARDQVIPRLGQFHWRSRLTMDLFCAGYGRPGGDVLIDSTFRPVLPQGPEGEWWFSDRAFDDVRRHVEAESGWRYSGEVDLLLANTSYDPVLSQVTVNFRSGIEVRLANAIEDKAVDSVAGFLERLFQYVEDNPDGRVSGFAARKGGATLIGSLMEVVLSALPVDLRPLWQKNRHLRPLAI